jgi:hypothetical protein
MSKPEVLICADACAAGSIKTRVSNARKIDIIFFLIS